MRSPLDLARVLLVAAALLAPACAGRPSGPASPAGPHTGDRTATASPEAPAARPGVKLIVSPEGGILSVDGAEVGPVAELPDGFVPLVSGLHRLAIRKDGFETWRAEVTVGDRIEELRVELKQLAP